MTTNVKALNILYRTELKRLVPKSTTEMSIHPRSAEWLAHLVEERRPAIVLELGSGLSTVLFANACAEAKAILYTYDHDQEWMASVRGVVKKFAKEGHLQRGEHYWLDRAGLVEASKSLLWRPNLVLVDHGPTMGQRLEDLPMLVKLAASGALIILDDCRKSTNFEREAAKVLAKLGLQLRQSERSKAHANRWMSYAVTP